MGSDPKINQLKRLHLTFAGFRLGSSKMYTVSLKHACQMTMIYRAASNKKSPQEKQVAKWLGFSYFWYLCAGERGTVLWQVEFRFS